MGFYDKPLLKFERLLETYLSFAPHGFASFLNALPLWFRQKLHLPRELSAGLHGAYRKKFVFTEHHESHAASAFFPSPFDEAAILTLDGVGEWATASFGVGRGNRIELTHELRFPHSIGLLYSAFTYFTGFRVNSGEYKLMGLAPYGTPRFAKVIREKLIDLKDDGSFRMDMSYFNYCQGMTMTSPKFDTLFEGPPRTRRVAGHRAGDGHRGLDPGGDRGDHAALCASRARDDGHEAPVPRRRRGPQLRRQRKDPARRPVRGHLDSAGRRGRGRRAWRGPLHLAPAARRAAPAPRAGCAVRLAPRAAARDGRHPGVPRFGRGHGASVHRRRRLCASSSPG